MKFEKAALTIPEQIALLKSRGMEFEEDEKAAQYLSNISYYRLSAYWYTLIAGEKQDHQFKKGTTFKTVINTYVFDRKLRLAIFDEIERIEIALRTQIIHHFCLAYGSNWYEEKKVFRQPSYYYKFNALMQEEMERTNEVFIRHYKSKYHEPANPPSWMVLELASFGQLSMLYKNLRICDAKKKVAAHFGLHENVLESWLETLAFIRNTCAHHSRLWNRKIPKPPVLPNHTASVWLAKLPEENLRNRMYIVLAAISYLLRQIIPNTSFQKRILDLLSEYPEIPIHYMGFTDDWKEEELWK